MSQPAPKKHGGMLRALIWGVALAAILGLAFYFLTLAIAAVLGYSAGGLVLSGELLKQFGYTNASHIIVAQGLNDYYQATSIPYIGALIGAGAGFAIGYFKGKAEDKEESQ